MIDAARAAALVGANIARGNKFRNINVYYFARSRSQRKSSRRSDRSLSPDEAPKKYVSKLKGRPSNFDVKPKDGVPLPPIVGLGTNIGGAPMNMNPAMVS